MRMGFMLVLCAAALMTPSIAVASVSPGVGVIRPGVSIAAGDLNDKLDTASYVLSATRADLTTPRRLARAGSPHPMQALTGRNVDMMQNRSIANTAAPSEVGAVSTGFARRR